MEPSGSPNAEELLDALYAAVPEEFIAARNEVARRLEEAGDAEVAGRIARLSKPTLTIWALNQLSRQSPELLDELLTLERRLAELQLRGAAAGAFREATRARHEAIGRLVEEGARVMEERGHPAGPAVRQRISATLYAVATDEQARELLRRGRLEREVEASGFGQVLPEPAGSAPAAAEPGRAAHAAARQRLEEARRRARKLAAEAGRLEAEAARLAQEAEAAERAARRAREAAAEARGAAHERRRMAEDAAAALTDAGGLG